MPWLLLLVALIAFAVAFTTTALWLLLVCLLVALLGLVGGVIGSLARRVGARTRDPDTVLIDPQALQRLREQAQTRQALDAARAQAP